MIVDTISDLIDLRGALERGELPADEPLAGGLPLVGLDGGTDAFGDAGPAEDADEAVESPAEGGAPVVGILHVGRGPLVRHVGTLADPVEGGVERGMVGKTLASWRTEILAHHATGASNGPTEGLNLLVKKVKRC